MRLPHLPEGIAQHVRRQEAGLEKAVGYGTAVVHKITRTLVDRRSESTCEPGDNSAICQKPTSDSTQTLPIVLGAVIPICCAICVFVYLHRKNKKKQAIEDANDPHKSLDFGVESSRGGAKNKRGFGGRKQIVPEMTITELGPDPTRPNMHTRGLSMDDMGSPYLLPAGLQGSGSIHSMSRNMQDEHDPYRPVTFVRSSTETSRSPRMLKENGSMYSASTAQTSDKSTLLGNAQRMSQSYPKREQSASPSGGRPPDDFFAGRELHSANPKAAAPRKASFSSSQLSLTNIHESSPPRRKESLPTPPAPPPPQAQQAQQAPPHGPETLPAGTASFSERRPPRKASLAVPVHSAIDRPMSDASFYGDEAPLPVPKVVEPETDYFGYDNDPEHIPTGRFSIDTPAPSQQFPVQNNRVSVMGLRPLPGDDPAENAEQRANRIRSFYKEYFDDSRPHPQNAVYEDYGPEYLDAAMYDNETGEYVYPQAPYAQPMGRRAMTPPPRGAAHFQGNHERHYSTQSARPGPRGRPGPRAPPKKKQPPPKALTSLPTPHMLRNDDAFLINPIDFAPPTSFREVQNGRSPDSPRGLQRPYSPSVKSYSPLVPAFDELSAMPSPHHLRKSGTFNGLDFAPPKFRAQGDTGSDAGSIRSAKSGISAMQMDAVRAGAYRVSRIPKQYVTSRDDLSSQLRPTMNLTTPA